MSWFTTLRVARASVLDSNGWARVKHGVKCVFSDLPVKWLTRRQNMENVEQKIPPRLKAVFEDRLIAELTEQFGYSSPMAVPRITKITLNMGVGEAVSDRKAVETAMADMELIAGQ